MGIEMTSRDEWLECLNKNKLQYPKEKRWRVEDKHHDKYFVVDGNTFALDKDDTISGISRSKNSCLKGRDILSMAVGFGGNKLQAFGKKLYQFYTKNGFCPLCTVEFDWRYAPAGCNKEDILVLYFYKGKNTSVNFDDFVKVAPKFKNIEKAKEYRKIIMSEK